MKKSLLVVLITNFFVLSASSQQNKSNEIDTNIIPVTTPDKYKFLSTQKSTESPLSISQLDLPKFDFEKSDSYQPDLNENLAKNMKLISNAPKSLFEKGIIRDQFLKRDFNISQISKLSDKLYLVQNSQHKTYPSLGSFLQFSDALRFTPNNKFSAELGGTFIRQFDHLSAKYADIWGSSVKVRYNITNNVLFNLFGQYISPSENFYHGYPLFQTSNFGSSLIFNITDHTQAEFGMKYQYYEFKKSWNTEIFGKLLYHF